MFDWVGLLLKVLYYYGQIIGLINFEIDWQRGRVVAAQRGILFAIAINVLICMVLLLQISKKFNLDVYFGRANQLHQYVIIVMVSLRMASGISAILNRWRQRAQLMRLVECVLRLFLKKPHVKQMSRWAILVKFSVGVVSNFLQMAISMESLDRLGFNEFVGMASDFWMSAIINMAISQHYLVILFVRAYYHLLKTEVRQAIHESQMLSEIYPRRAAFMTKCCYLADRIDNIAKLQNQLQSIVTQLNQVFGIQGIMVYGGYYIFSVATTYITYSLAINGIEELHLSVRAAALVFSWFLFYYTSAILNLFVMLKLFDDHKEMERILEERTLFTSALDVRLEQSFESIQLQLIRNPLKIEVLDIFTITRSSSAAMIGSIITNSIFLIQYDMEYF
uniref:Putative gustatory receptor 36a n=1 Tax=Drosophila melanogaster TaxID=7227 RepID=GR36A_DROME|nr:gustatory receptor 36a [Drosophila melanogaster]P58955.1 RecName: Full=Putative gustatory receptor 36a [Drosophila melanogaster]AAN10981.2 gustatory receptor 36a [Drosophila melanogaster]|eukprot:NP_724038.2 gustatory receptor 36a [Drosophila melanogaster]